MSRMLSATLFSNSSAGCKLREEVDSLLGITILGEDFSGIFIEANLPSPQGVDLSRTAAELLREVLQNESKIDSMIIARGALAIHPRFPANTIMIHVGMKKIKEIIPRDGRGPKQGLDIRGNVIPVPE